MREPTEMELRVTQAICCADSASRGEPGECAYPECGCADIPGMARAAIRAMREPTESMTDTGMGYAGNDDILCAVGIAWRAMIDAASPPE